MLSGPYTAEQHPILRMLAPRRANPNLILYLNELVGNAHGTIYAEPPSGWSGIWKFFASELPAILRKRMPFILAAVAITIVGAYYAYAVIRHNPAMESLFIPDGFKSSFDAWKTGFSDHGDISVGGRYGVLLRSYDA